MKGQISSSLSLLFGCATAFVAAGDGKINEDDYSQDSIRIADIAIVGGGASGSYAAVRLRDDYNQSIVVIEKAGKLGGHANTYTDPATDTPYDFGVQVYVDIGDDSRAFFERFGVETGPPPAGVTSTINYVDFTTGTKFPSYALPDEDASSAAMAKYLEICAEYSHLLTPGMYDWPDDPEDVPEDLLMSFGDFAAKYEIEAALPSIYITTGFGVGDFLGAPTWEVMKTYGASFDLSSGFYRPASYNNSELYGKIAEQLGHDVLYMSHVARSERSEDGILLDVISPGSGGRGSGKTLVKAKKLLIAIEPTVDNMAPFSPSEEEAAIWSAWDYSTEYTSLVTHPALEPGMSYQNAVPAMVADNTSHYDVFPVYPQVGDISYWGAEDSPNGPLWKVLVVGTEEINAFDARRMIREAFGNMAAAGTISSDVDPDEIHFVDFAVHGPMHVRVTPEEMKNGFPQRMYALQGQRNTWYTGAAWSQHFTTVVWNFTDTILPQLLAG